MAGPNGMDKAAVKRQHDKGKLTAFERLDLLLDKDSFVELQDGVELQSHHYGLQDKKQARDGVVTGFGTIHGRNVCVYAQDFTFMGGSMGKMHNKKIAMLQEKALTMGVPIIGIFDSGGARIQEGINSLDAGGAIFKNNTHSSGVIPQISIIVGPCAGIAVYSPALTDFICLVKDLSNMFITGPDVIKSVTGEAIDFEGLGGAVVHNQKSGVAHFISNDEKACFENVKLLMSYLPQNNMDNPHYIQVKDSPTRENSKLVDMIPSDPKKSYDVKAVIQEIVDKNTFLEVQELFAQNAVVGLARLNSQTVGIIANQPQVLAGCLDIDSSNKIARFVRFCDAFNIPLVNLIDVTGYLPGVDQEHKGIIRNGAKILYAFSEATVPKISLIMRKAYGGAYIALCSKEMGYDMVLCWPESEVAVMGAEQAVNIINRRDLQGPDADKVRKEKVKEYTEQFLNPSEAASQGIIDKVIDIKATRKTLISSLQLLQSKRERRPNKKHGNVPL